jgi:acyl transferase domain-containing protein/acyl-CoA synthetase (AMP-forming)/AMP-acid ligase II
VESTSTILTLLETLVVNQPDAYAMTWLHNGETPAGSLTYRQLAQQARTIAGHLRHSGVRPGECVLLVYAEGLEFLPAFLGCLYAGVVAVPMPAPDALRGKRALPHMQAVYADAGARGILTTQRLKDLLPLTQALPILTTDDLLAGGRLPDGLPAIVPNQLAYLQYTSGSTGTPKGVMISHANVIANLAALNQAWGYTADSVTLTWMPHTHDFGLVEGLLRPLLAGVPNYIMPPGAFLRKPLRWLKAISALRVTHSAGAAFAYQHVLQYLEAQDCADLDLSHWRIAELGAEPIRPALLEDFATAFAPCGLERNALCPGYGLAEATLMVTARNGDTAPLTHALTHNSQTTQLTGCGYPWADTEIEIVDPTTHQPLPEGDIGEIWVAGASVAQGYWNRPEETQETFGNGLNGKTYLRTGDLGLINQGALFITGRLKDLIILNGQNYYPSDIEWSLDAAHPLLQNGSKAVFAIEEPLAAQDTERLAIICEIDPRAAKTTDLAAVAQTIVERVGTNFLLPVQCVILIRRGTLPKTPSGKVQRRACRTAWLKGEVESLFTWQIDRDASLASDLASDTLSNDGTNAGFAAPRTPLEKTLAQIWCEVLDVPTVSVTANLFAQGVNSLLLMRAYNMMCQQLDRYFLPVELFSYPDIRSLARYLSGEAQAVPADVQEPPEQQPGATLDESLNESVLQGIAVIGMAGHFPGAKSVAEFWENLQNGVESIRPFSDEELLAQGVRANLLQNPAYVKAGAVLEHIDRFDAAFFGMSPREAAITDPQQRLLLECAWEACEAAGYDPKSYPGLIGVFAGSGASSYRYINLAANQECWNLDGALQISLGNEKDYLATRISFRLGLRGPSMTVQTACSTSLVAIHLACRSLLNDECDMALAGGVSLQLPHGQGYLYQESGIASSDGHCRAFDADASGTVFGSGAGVILLKRLADAVKDGDTILAVIKGTAINNDGATKAGFTAPSVPGQAAAITATAATAGVPFDAIGYVEAHGTATSLGDPIEIEALTRAFRTQTNARGFCAIGSVKTNIGHLDAAAGIAGLIKTVLALHHRQLPPSLHFHRPNPHIDFANSPFYVNTALMDWKTEGAPRIAGIHTFGMGGTNAHAIVTEAPVPAPSSPGHPWLLFPLSARTPRALEEATARLVAHLRAHPEIPAADVAYTLQVGRHSFASRRLVLGRDTEEAIRSLEAPTAENAWTKAAVPSERRVVFLFPGQGLEMVNHGRELYEAEPVFRDTVDQCATFLTPLLGQDLRDLLYPSPEREAWANEQMHRTAFAQPATFVFEYALAQLWRAWGVHPAAMIGHSLGEFVAACLSGVFSLSDGLRLVAERGRLMQQVPAGAMLAVALPEHEAQELLSLDSENRGGLSLAAVNGPRQCILSGELMPIEQVEAVLAERDVPCTRLSTSHAFHSGMMNEAIAPFTAAVCQVTLTAPQIPYISNVTGTWAQADEVMSADYWGCHLRQPVRYGTGIENVIADFPDAVLLEVGHGTVLTRLSRLMVGEGRCTTIPSLPGAKGLSKGAVEFGLREATEATPLPGREEKALLEALGRLWLEGVSVDWRSFTAGQRRLRVPLPTYPFQRKRHWIEPDTYAAFQGNGLALTDGAAHPHEETTAQLEPLVTADDTDSSLAVAVRKPDISDWFYLPGWKRSLLLPPFVAKPAADKQITWIVFTDNSALGAQLIQRLQQSGGTVVEVHHGPQYLQQDPNRFTISPAAPQDYVRLLREMVGEIGPDLRILHLWNQESFLDPSVLDPLVTDPLQTCQERGFHSALSLAQALQATPRPNGRVTIVMVTQHLCDVSGNERLQPEKATLLGPCMVIPQENPDLHCRCVDIMPPSNPQQSDWLVDQLLAESGRMTRELLIAYRGKSRWLQDYHPVRIPPQQMQLSALRQEGVYLITGGMGEVGLALAEHLGRTAHARVILLGRTQFPPRDQWEEWVKNHPETDAMSARIQRLIALESVAASVSVLSVDVAEPGQLQRAVDSIYERFGDLHGVFHAASIVRGDRAFLPGTEMGAETVEMHFRPKVLGLRALEQALGGRAVDFCVLFGSNSAVLGGFGFAAYAAGNAFMNAFAADRSKASTIRWICVNWDAWRTASLPTSGMPEALVQNMAITEAEGMAVLDRVLSDYPSGPVVVSAVDLVARQDCWVGQRSGAQRLKIKEDAIDPAPARENIKTAYIAPTTDTERGLVEIWQDQLGVAPIGIRDDFFALGGDSLLAIRLITRIQQDFQQTLALATFVFDPTIAHLATQLDAMQAPDQPANAIPTAGQSQPTRLGSPLADKATDKGDALRECYDLLGQPEALRRARVQEWIQRPPGQSRMARLLHRLPAPMALLLLRQSVRSPRAQQRYWAREVALIRAFHAVIDTQVAAELMIENSLFYNLLERYGFHRHLNGTDRYSLDQFLAARPASGRAHQLVAQVTRLDLVDQAKQQGRGVILAGHHSLAVNWVPHHLWFQLVNASIFNIDYMIDSGQLDKDKAEPILYARQLEVAIQALQRGEVVVIMPDGNHGSSPSHEVHFHGRRKTIRFGFAELALLTGASVLPMLGEIQPGGPTTLRLLAPLDMGDEAMPYATRVEHLSTQYEEHLDRIWRTMPWVIPWELMAQHLARPN